LTAFKEKKQFGGRKRNFSGEKFWVRGYAVSTIGLEIEIVRNFNPPQFPIG